MNSLIRFYLAQETKYAIALAEIQAGRKQNHWIWYIFPQIAGLGRSETAQFYALKDVNEAKLFLEDAVLGTRLREITQALLALEEVTIYAVMGTPDDMKVKSCMTLFAEIDTQPDAIFQQVLDKYYAGEKDLLTLELM
ncbi:MAG: DUF1810 domain-containing protein [Spirosomataceae bacterium]